MTSIFIDGEAGTTGLGIRERLTALPVDVRSIAPDARKNPSARQAMMAEVELVILCLPDEAAREAVSLAEALGPRAPRILDASTAHRIAPGWTYGFAELSPAQPARIAAAARVSNPGCYATGAIALLAPLVAAGLIPPGHPLSINAVSGYSGGGRQMIEAHEATGGPAFELYATSLEHKHVPEITHHAGLATAPLFVPSAGHFRQGMLVSVPLHLNLLPGRPGAQILRAALAQHYAGSAVQLVDPAPARPSAEALNDTDGLQIFVYEHPHQPQALLVARLDNLGKGASGAAVQNLRLMLGLEAPPRHEHG